MNIFMGLYQIIGIVLIVGMVVLFFYVLILVIKALKIYLKNNK